MLEPDGEIWQYIYIGNPKHFFFGRFEKKKSQIANLRQEEGWTVGDESC